MSEPQTLGEEIRARRIGLALGRKEVALEAGISADYLRGIESDRQSPRPQTLRRLAEVLKVDVEEWTPLWTPPHERNAARR